MREKYLPLNSLDPILLKHRLIYEADYRYYGE